MVVSEEALKQKIKALEKEVAKVSQERDDLTRDLENLCLSAGANTTFSSSSVLSERIYSTEKELGRCKAQLQTVIEERDALRDDLRGVKEAKRQADVALKEQQQRAQSLDRELAFYQQQAAKVMADRDKAAWEAEELRGQTLQLDAALREASSRAETEQAQRRQLESQAQFLKNRVVELEAKAAEAAVVPSLRQELGKAGQEIRRLQQCEQRLQDEAKQLQRQLGESEGSRQAAEREVAAKQKQLTEQAASRVLAEKQLQEEIQQLKAEGESLRKRLDEVEALAEERGAAAVTAQQDSQAAARQLEERERQLQQEHAADLDKLLGEHEKEVSQLRAALGAAEAAAASARSELEEVAQQKVAALMRQSTAETAKSKADASIERLMVDLSKFREQLEQATKEKVAALMQIAELKAAAEAARAVGRSDSAEDGAGPRGHGAPSKAAPAVQHAEKKGWFGSPLMG